VPSGHFTPTGVEDTHSRTRASQEPIQHPSKNHRRWKVTRDTQAACEFSLWMSKSSPFFHSVSVMAAILRASVRRAMVGLMPFGERALVKLLERSGLYAGPGGRAFKQAFQIMVEYCFESSAACRGCRCRRQKRSNVLCSTNPRDSR
jgi:hypothetical protein